MAHRATPPFTVAHFAAWAHGLILDTDEPIILEPFQLAFIEDVFSGVPEAWLVIPEGNGKTTLPRSARPVPLRVPAACRRRGRRREPRAGPDHVQPGRGLRPPLGSPPRAPPVAGPDRQGQGARRSCRASCASRATAGSSTTRAGASRSSPPTTGRATASSRRWASSTSPIASATSPSTGRGRASSRSAAASSSPSAPPASRDPTSRRRASASASSRPRSSARARSCAPPATGSILHEWAVPEGADVEDLDIVKAANPFSGITPDTLAEQVRQPDDDARALAALRVQPADARLQRRHPGGRVAGRRVEDAHPRRRAHLARARRGVAVGHDGDGAALGRPRLPPPRPGRRSSRRRATGRC